MKIKIQKDSVLKKQLLQLEIALIIDNTGSMGGEIAQVKTRLRELLGRITEHELKLKSRFAVIGYRDHPPQDHTFAAHTFCELEADSYLVQQALNKMSASGGGDGPEAVVDGLRRALDLRWAKAAQKAVLLVGDAPPHGEGSIGDGFRSGCPCGESLDHIMKEMSSLSITGHAVGVRADPSMTLSFSRFAKGTGGIFVPLAGINDLIPLLLRHIDVEIGKIATDLRTIEKLERGDVISGEDLESLRRLEKKGVRPITLEPGETKEPEPEKKPRIRILN